MMTWDECHAMLAIAIDAVEAGDPGWIRDMTAAEMAATSYELYPPARWKEPGTLFARDLHYHLDMALRSDGDKRRTFLATIRARLASKFEHQGEFASLLARLAAQVRTVVGARGKLDPDTADPLVALRDGLAQHDVSLARWMCAELLRPDKYMFQQIDTRKWPVLLELQDLLTNAAHDCWPPLGKLSTCGAVAQGHPERNTWYSEELEA